MSIEGQFKLEIEHLDDYEFRVDFDWDKVQPVVMDEPPPLGGRKGPNASRMLAAAVANCLSASLMYCLVREETPSRAMHTQVTCKMVRNEKKRLRVGGMDVRMTLGEELTGAAKLRRCLDLFEDFCVVTASIRQGIPVSVEVLDAAGTLLHSS